MQLKFESFRGISRNLWGRRSRDIIGFRYFRVDISLRESKILDEKMRDMERLNFKFGLGWYKQSVIQHVAKFGTEETRDNRNYKR